MIIISIKAKTVTNDNFLFFALTPFIIPLSDIQPTILPTILPTPKLTFNLNPVRF